MAAKQPTLLSSMKIKRGAHQIVSSRPNGGGCDKEFIARIPNPFVCFVPKSRFQLEGAACSLNAKDRRFQALLLNDAAKRKQLAVALTTLLFSQPPHASAPFGLIEGRSDAELKALLDAAHRAMLSAFKVPERDRYQIVHEHKPSHMIIEDTGLSVPRTDKVVFLQVTSRPREREAKQAFYRLFTEELERSCQIASSDLIVSIIENTDEDWSFGLGRAQFLTGDL